MRNVECGIRSAERSAPTPVFPPVIPAKAGIHVPPNPHFALPIPNSVPPLSFRRKPESTPPQIHTSHSQFQTPSPPSFRRKPESTSPPNPHSALPIPNSVPPALRDTASTPRRRSTTETAEARKGRGPRFPSGRRGRAIPPPVIPPSPPVIPAKAGIHVAPNPHFALPIPNSVPPALRDSASTPRRRSTTEPAEARKGRGPRFSSGRRGRAIPPTRHSAPPSFRRKPESTSPQPSGTAPRLPDDGQPLS